MDNIVILKYLLYPFLVFIGYNLGINAERKRYYSYYSKINAPQKIKDVPLHVEPNTESLKNISEDISIEVTNDEDFFSYKEAKPKSLYDRSFVIEYIDKKHRTTTRTIRNISFDTEYRGGLIWAYCELREDSRMFYINQIKHCIDLKNNEPVENINEFLTHEYNNSPERYSEYLGNEYPDICKVLIYVSRADGKCLKSEKIVMLRYFEDLINKENLELKTVNSLLDDFGTQSIHQFKGAIARLTKISNIDRHKLLRCCNDIVATQKKVHPAEREAIEYIEKKWEIK